MILGSKVLLQLVKEINLVEGLCERELTNPEGAGFDLQLAEIYELQHNAIGYLGIEKRRTPEVDTIATKRGTPFYVRPQHHYLVRTVETLNLPEWLTANFKPRGTLFRCGLNLRTGNAAPGYHGTLVFSLYNEGPCVIELEIGARIAHVQFEEVLGEVNPYRGQWTGGRLTTNGTEVQV